MRISPSCLFQLLCLTLFPLVIRADPPSEDIVTPPPKATAEEQVEPTPLAQKEIPSTLTGEWGGRRTELREKGVDIQASITLDDTWNLDGGLKKNSKGDFEYLVDVRMQMESDPLWHYPGGTFFVDFEFHHGKSPSVENVGSYIFVDLNETTPFNELYALWYKQSFNQDQFWILAGKSDAYDHFTTTTHTTYFLNGGYEAITTIPYLPTYPDTAMSVIASLALPFNISLTGGIFDGSYALGVKTGELGVFGHFFNHLSSHAFLIGEANMTWQWHKDYKGRIGFGGWRNTAHVPQFNGEIKKATSGPYFTLDQIFYKTDKREYAFVFEYGSTDPSYAVIRKYYGTALTFQGLIPKRTEDTLGIGSSLSKFTKESIYTKPYEASYEIFYQYQFKGWGFLEPDFQYIVHPGGEGLPNASVLTLRLFVNI